MSSSRNGAEPRLDAQGVEHLLGYLLSMADVPARRAFQRHIGKPLQLRPVEFTLLLLLLDHDGHALPKQIGPALRLPGPHVTTLIDRLAERDLVQRSRHPEDGRAVQVELTIAGRKLSERARRLSLTMEEGLLAPLTVAEGARLRALLIKLVRAQSTPRA